MTVSKLLKSETHKRDVEVEGGEVEPKQNLDN